MVRSRDDMTPETLMDVSREKVRIQIAGNMITVLPIITASLQKQTIIANMTWVHIGWASTAKKPCLRKPTLKICTWNPDTRLLEAEASQWTARHWWSTCMTLQKTPPAPSPSPITIRITFSRINFGPRSAQIIPLLIRWLVVETKSQNISY